MGKLMYFLIAFGVLLLALFAVRFPRGTLSGLRTTNIQAEMNQHDYDHYVRPGQFVGLDLDINDDKDEVNHDDTVDNAAKVKPYTFYRLFGPDDAPNKIAFVHGISTPSVGSVDFLEALINILNENGDENNFQIVSFDCFGRGFSDSPDAPSVPKLYTAQLSALLKYLQWDKVTLIGYSLGGSIASHFAVQYPDKVEKALLIAPAAVKLIAPTIWFSLRNQLLATPLIGEAIGKFLIPPVMKSAFGDTIPAGPIRDVAVAQMATDAYSRTMYRTVINMDTEFTGEKVEKEVLTRLTEPIYGDKKKSLLPILLVWGDEDQVVLPECAELWQQLIPHCGIMILENEDHVLVNKAPKRLAESVAGFFSVMD